MLDSKRSGLDQILNVLMTRYKERVPDVQKIIDAMIQKGIIKSGDDIQNDHIAFRTIGVPLLGIQSLERIFLYYGYQKKEAYYFKDKKLNAYWYAPPSEDLPRIFISELRVQDLSQKAQRVITSYTDEIKQDPTLNINLADPQQVSNFLHASLWRLPSYKDYKQLLEESEYASWVIYNRYYLNHYTVSIHDLPEPYDRLQDFDMFLEENGIVLNDSGGKIKTSSDGLLLQSSTVSGMVEAVFKGGEHHSISGSYIEFTERKVLPQFSHLPAHQLKRKHRREGFEADNADRIFESTYSNQTSKNN